MRLFKRPLSVRHQQTIIIMIVSITTLIVASALFVTNEIITLTRHSAEEIENKAIIIANNSVSAILFDDDRSAKKTLSSLKSDSAVRVAVLYSGGNKKIAWFRRNGIQDEIPKSKSEDGTRINDDVIEAFYPVMLSGARIGSVFIRSDLTNLNQKIVEYGYIVFGVLLLSMLLAWLLSRRLQRVITEPIQQLADLAKHVSSKQDYSTRLSLKRDDELGTLIDGFNTMLSVIQDREQQLRVNSDRLEDLVRLRTEQLHERAYFDSLTGLPNRNLLLDRLSKLIAGAKRNNQCLALLFLDLDRFKTINDSLGHYVGDEILKCVSHRLANMIREGDSVCRLGGDEFVVLLANITSPGDAAKVARKIVSQMAEAVELPNSKHSLYISASIGISIYPKDGATVDALMKNADASMYKAKSSGPGQYCFFEEEMNAISHKRLSLENHLRDALVRDEFTIHYQPQVRLKDNLLIGVEALLRWNNPELGNVCPADFIPIAEEIGIIKDIGAWVLRCACMQNKEWQLQGHPPVIMAVNLSASDLQLADLVPSIRGILTETALDPEFLEIEITEDIFINHSDRIIRNLGSLKNLGIHIAIDDFGTGYSSLSYLQRFPMDTLKLDGSFIQNIGKSKTSENIVSAVINLVHSLGLKMVAESIETKPQWDFLSAHDCDHVQGYYYSEPLTKALMTKFFMQQQQLKTALISGQIL